MTKSTDEEIAREIADTIIRDVAELPDRTSPEYDGDVMLVTADELRQIVMHPLTEALRSVRAEEREECAKVADAKADEYRRLRKKALDMGIYEGAGRLEAAANGCDEAAVAIRSRGQEAST